MKRVLIVDDEKLFLLSLLEGLKAYSDQFTADMAVNGREALEKLEGEHYDLVVTDLRMPEMDGMELLARMSKKFPNLPVIVMTAYPSPNAYETTRGLGCSKFLEKPIDLEDLANKIIEELSSDSAGFLKGIALPTFLQLVEMEGKTYTIKVKSGKRTGWLYFLSGELLQAEVGQTEGADAALEMICWENAEIEISSRCRKTRGEIGIPVSHLILEAHRRYDESQESDLPDYGLMVLEEAAEELKWSPNPEKAAPETPTAQELEQAREMAEARELAKAEEMAEARARGIKKTSDDKADLNWARLQLRLRDFEAVTGFLGAGLFSGSKEKGTWIEGNRLNLDKAGPVLIELQKASEKLCEKADLGRCKIVEVETNEGYVLSKCLSADEPDEDNRIFLSLILDESGEIAMGKIKMNLFASESVRS
ncbi:response regulator [bacterium]|nr:MAG: response regulator [bacterium]